MNSHISNVRLLYKAILRLHRALPVEIQQLGNEYVRNEFRRHKKCNPNEAIQFMTEWSRYAMDLSQQIRHETSKKATKSLGSPLNEDTLNKMRDEQIVQLYELMRTTRGEN